MNKQDRSQRNRRKTVASEPSTNPSVDPFWEKWEKRQQQFADYAAEESETFKPGLEEPATLEDVHNFIWRTSQPELVEQRYKHLYSEAHTLAKRSKVLSDFSEEHHEIAVSSKWFQERCAELKMLEPLQSTRTIETQSRKGVNAKKPGRASKLQPDFVEFAARLWIEAQCENGQTKKITVEQLKQIALELDAKGYVPPANYLEQRFAEELRRYNSHHSNSKTGPITNWTKLVTTADKDHVRGTRRLLSRCAERLKTAPARLSGN
jgi:hypothetical protein